MDTLPGTDRHLYVFVRQDLTLTQQIVQSNHASLSIASRHHIEGIPNIVIIGVPDRAGLAEAIRRMIQWGLGYYAWFEPDFDLGLTAVATVPLDRDQRKLFSNYALWRPVSPTSRASSVLERSSLEERSGVQLPGAAPVLQQ